MSGDEPLRPETLVIHAGLEPMPEHGPVSVPIYQSSTFSFASAEEGAARFAGTDPGYRYTRLGNPTTRALEHAVCSLEGGYAALATSSGMAAVSTVTLALLAGGDHVVATDAVYGPTRTLIERQLSKFGIASTWVPSEDLDAVGRAVTAHTRLLFVETPANPTMKLTDLAGCASVAHGAGALLVVDNTFCSPLRQRPLTFGADVVLHSMTKFLNGHSDVVAGVIVSARRDLHEAIGAYLIALGGTMDPHQAWLVLRGMRTLAMRMDRAEANAGALAAWLAVHPRVAWVSYPGLDSHPQHELVCRQMSGPGAMIAFGVRGGLTAARTVIDNVHLAVRAVSLGGVETLIEHPASMTHAGLPRDERLASGLSDDLIRLAVGCEAAEDLKADLDQALRAGT